MCRKHFLLNKSLWVGMGKELPLIRENYFGLIRVGLRRPVFKFEFAMRLTRSLWVIPDSQNSLKRRKRGKPGRFLST